MPAPPEKRSRSGPVSRVLYARRPIGLTCVTAISLGRRLPGVSSSRPERRVGSDGPARPCGHGRSAWPCSGWGLPSQPGRPGRWCALTAPFHPYRSPVWLWFAKSKPQFTSSRGGLLSVALSRALRPVGVTDHPCPVEPGLSSPSAVGNALCGVPFWQRRPLQRWQRPSGPLRDHLNHIAIAGKGIDAL